MPSISATTIHALIIDFVIGTLAFDPVANEIGKKGGKAARVPQLFDMPRSCRGSSAVDARRRRSERSKVPLSIPSKWRCHRWAR